MMNNEKKEIESEKEETFVEFLSRSPLDAILTFLDRSDEPPRHVDLWFEEEYSLVHEASPKANSHAVCGVV